MKKLKKQRSITTKPKQANDSKIPVHSKKNLLSKKPKECHKQNKSILQDGSFYIKPPHKANVRQKTRSKSLIFDRKVLEPSPKSSKRYALMEILQKKIEKADTDISAHLNSVRYDRHLFDVDKICSNFLSPHHQRQEPKECFSDNKNRNELTPKLKLLQQENETLRSNLTALKEERDTFLKQNELAKEENHVLKGRITDFQFQAQTQISMFRQKEDKLSTVHKHEKQQLEDKVTNIQSEQNRLIQEKNALEKLVKSQQKNITILENEKQQLQAQCEAERKQKAMLKKDKEEATIRIKSLEQELNYFEANLKQFEQMKETYQKRLVLLQKQKQKIKRNAFELLEMVQSYRDC